MPMTIPNVVNAERIGLARMADQEMRRPSRTSVKMCMAEGNEGMTNDQLLAIGHWTSVIDYPHAFITGNQAIPDSDDSLGMPRHVLLVGHDDDRVAFLGQ